MVITRCGVEWQVVYVVYVFHCSITGGKRDSGHCGLGRAFSSSVGLDRPYRSGDSACKRR